MKYAIVTGGSRGLGVGIVDALLEHNVVDEVATISRTEPRGRPNGHVHCFLADVTDDKQVHEAAEAIAEKLGPHPSVLCNNAGGGEREWFFQSRDGSWEPVVIFRRFIDLNLNSLHIVTKEIAPRMTAGAAICNITSAAGQVPNPILTAYSTAKAGADMYTRSCALRLAPRGIRVNAVAPGFIYTPVWEVLGAALGGGDEKARATFDAVVDDMVPLGRDQTVEDIARAVAWLCSDDAQNITGQILSIDGGTTLGPLARMGRNAI